MKNNKKINLFVFWTAAGLISPHLLCEFFAMNGLGNFFPEQKNKKNSEPLLVKIFGNIVYLVNVTYLLDLAKRHIIECTAESGESGPIVDSLHRSTGLFSDKNLKLLPTL